MRRSEICVLRPEDIDGDIVRISKSMVQNTQKEWVIKTIKTTESTREITIPMDLAEKIRAQGYIYKDILILSQNILRKLRIGSAYLAFSSISSDTVLPVRCPLSACRMRIYSKWAGGKRTM